MKKQSTILLMILVVVSCLIMIAGCGDDGNRPPVDALYILAWTDGISTGQFALADTELNVIDIEGIRLDVFGGDDAWYSSNNGVGGVKYTNCRGAQYIESSNVTGLGGRITLTGWRVTNNPTGYMVQSAAEIDPPAHIQTASNPSFSYRSITNINGLVNQAASISGHDGTLDGYVDPYPLADNGDDAQEIAGVSFTPVMSTWSCPDNLTDSELIAITSSTTNAPAIGIQPVACNLVRQNGCNGYRSSVDADWVFPINLVDPNNFLRHAGPYAYSYTFKTAAPVELDGYCGHGIVKTDMCSEGVSVGFHVVASSEDMQTHVARSDYFLPVDSTVVSAGWDSVEVYDRYTPFAEPNIWDKEQYDYYVNDDWLDVVDPNLYSDPNIIPDPNVLFDPTNPAFYTFNSRLDTRLDCFNDILIEDRVIDVKIIPISWDSNESIRVAFEPDLMGVILQGSPYWLSDNATFDANGDGIVNLIDMYYYAPISGPAVLPPPTEPPAALAEPLATSSMSMSDVEEITANKAAIPFDTFVDILVFLDTVPVNDDNQENIHALRMMVIEQFLIELE